MADVARRWSLCTDFDGTLIEQIVTTLLDDAFGRGDPAPLDDAYRAGAIGLAEHTARRFGRFRVGRDELVATALAGATVRPGVAEAVRLCRRREVRLRVLSSGLDAYVLPVLCWVGVDADEVTCSRATFDDAGIRAVAPAEIEGLDFKAAAVRAERAAGRAVLYVGDGSNDRAAAEQATFVLARRRLLDHCRERGLPHAPFEDFRDVCRWLERNVSAPVAP